MKLRPSSLLAALAFLLVLTPALAELPSETPFPRQVTYTGEISDAASTPLEGVHTMTLSYFGTTGELLLTETLLGVAVSRGHFSIELGTGVADAHSPYPSLQAVFAKHPRLSLEVSIGETTFGPRIGILPAGHSVKSHLVAAGARQEDDDDPHWKHYEARNSTTAFQSGALAPGEEDPSVAAAEQGRVWRRPYTLPGVGPFISTPVRELPKSVPPLAPPSDIERQINPPRHETVFDDQGQRFGTASPKIDDALALNTSPGQRTPAPSITFEGISNIQGFFPPDTEGAVGPNHYVQAVNVSFAVLDKTGTFLAGPVDTNTLWSGFGGPCQNDNSGDAIFLYDEEADRFVLSQFAVSGSNQSVCFAVSQTPDPTGSYYLYEFVTPRFPDYYKVGVWNDPNNNAYFFGTNSGFQNQYDVFAIDRANMLAGNSVRPIQFFQNFYNLMMPADIDGPTGPPTGSPGVFYTFRDGGESYFNNPSADSIDVYEFDVDWNTPANSTYTLVEVITPTQGLANFNWTVCGFFVSNCIPQPGTSQGIDSASWWPMQRLVYRNFGSHETLIGAWTVDVNSVGDRAAPRWFELRDTGAGWFIHQQGTQSPDATHRWMPSIAMDGSGNIALGYSLGDGGKFPSIFYATREEGDALGTLQGEVEMWAGGGSQTATGARWGDYSSMELDPSDDCTFWYTTEYLATTSPAGWQTRIGAFTIPGCGGPPNDAPVVTITSPADGSSSDIGTNVSFAGTASDTEDGDLTANLSWTSSIDGTIGSGGSFSTSTLSLGAHIITASVTDSGGKSGSDTINITVVDPNSNGPQNAVYDGGLGVPACSIAGSSCDSTSLVDGRANLGPEPNQPNTLDGCADGTSGVYHSDESNDRIVVSTLDNADFEEGATVQIDATVWAWNTGSEDSLDLYYAADANSPSWVYITTLTTPTGGAQTLSTTYTLPNGSLQAVRAAFRYQGSVGTCVAGNWNDRDDLAFAVRPAGGNAAPTVTITSPSDGSSFGVGESVSFTGTASDPEDGDISASLDWTSSLDGAIGTGASFSTSTLSEGSHTITASVTDSGGESDNDVINITISGNAAPTVSITSPADGSSFVSGSSVSFAGTANDPEDGDITASLSWTSSLDGAIGSGGGFATSSLSIGSHLITASVTDSGGENGSDAITVNITAPNTAPTVTITAPADGSGFNQGDSVAFSGTATDTEDGDISANLSWTSSLDGSIGSGASFATSALSVGTHTITASVTDSGGLSDSDQISVTINPVGGGGSKLWMSFRSNTAVPGVGTVTDEDIVSYDEVTGLWSLEFDGSDVGLGGLEISGMAILPSGDIIMSFTAAGTVDGITVDDSDIVQFTPTSLGSTTAGSFAIYFDGSDVGLTTNGEDVDGIALDSAGNLVISTLGTASINGIGTLRDEDSATFVGTLGASTSGTFSVTFDGSDVGLNNSSGEDVDAIGFTAGGNLIFSTVGTFSVTGVSGEDEDVVEFSGTFGSSTSGTFSMRQDLTGLGIASGEDIGSLHVVE
jgi:hypothetical protein